MRTPDWRMWLLHDRPRELAQVVFLLHPEWQDFASETEVGGLELAIPCGTDTIRLICDDEVTRVEYGLDKRTLEDREAMRYVESLLATQKSTQMRG